MSEGLSRAEAVGRAIRSELVAAGSASSLIADATILHAARSAAA